MCMPADSAYWVTLSCSSRAMRCRSSSSTSRCRAAPSSAWVSSSSSLRALRSSACRLARSRSRSEWSSSAQFCRAAAVWPARIRSTEWSVSSISRSSGVHAANPPDARGRRAGPARAGGGAGSPRRAWSSCGTAADLVDVAADLVGDGPSAAGHSVAVRAAHQVARAGVGELAVDEGEHDPLRRQVVGGRLDDRADQRLGALHGAHERGGDPFQRVDHPAHPLGRGAVLGVVVRLARPQAGERLEVGTRRGSARGAGRRGGHCAVVTWPP